MDYPDQLKASLFLKRLLRSALKKGSIDVNIMAKVDKMNFAASGEFLGDTNTRRPGSAPGFCNE